MWRIVYLMKSIKISVIVPIYNVKEYIGKCIESIINQIYENLEIILVDDGSKDGSSDICDYYAKIPQVHVQAVPQAGRAGEPRNAGRGQFVWIVGKAAVKLVKRVVADIHYFAVSYKFFIFFIVFVNLVIFRARGSLGAVFCLFGGLFPGSI